MPKFSYKAKLGPDKIVDGVIDAENYSRAVSQINRSGAIALEVTETTNEKATSFSRKIPSKFTWIKKVRSSDIVLFTRQISDLVEASVPILKGIEIVARQTPNKNFRMIVLNIYESIKNGSSLSSALLAHPQYFSPLYINMIRTGEAGGQLDKVLSRLAQYLEKQQETRSKVRASLAYPSLIFVIGIITVFVLFSFVIPRLSIMFEDMGQELPTITLLLVNVSHFFERFWMLIIGFFILGGVSFRQTFSSSRGRRALDEFKLKIPLLGNFLKIVDIGRFLRTLGTLIDNGVSITDALNTSWPIIDNKMLQQEIKLVAADVSGGRSIHHSLAKCRYFPEMAVNMISVAEETGDLATGLFRVADNFEKEADQVIKTMISLLGPLVLVGVVAIVGVVIVAMLLPIFQMNLLIQ